MIGVRFFHLFVAMALSATVCLLAGLPSPAEAASMWDPVARRLVQSGLDGPWVAKLFARPEMVYDPEPMGDKLRALYKSLKGGVTVRKIQEQLATLGRFSDTPDGKYGPGTRAAIEAFQESQGLPVDGLPNQDVVDALEKALTRAGKASPLPTVWTHGRVHAGVLKPFRLAEAREFHVANYGTLQGMTAQFGVPGEMATAILTVETRHGRILGHDRAVTILASMALDGDPDRATRFFSNVKMSPSETHWLKETARIRGDWAFEELAALLRWCKATGKDPFSFPSSPYGAVGLPQFMPSNIEKFGADGDGDGKVDLFLAEDAIYSIGKYFKGWGWSGKMDLGKRQQVVWRYNRSETYVNTVLGVAEHLTRELAPVAAPARAGAPVVVNSLPSLQAALGSNRRIELAPGNYNTRGVPLLLQGLQRLTLVGRGEVLLPALQIDRCQDVFLENLAVRPVQGTLSLVAVTGSSSVTLQHVRLHGPAGIGLAADGAADLRLLQCLIEQTRGPALSGFRTTGLKLINGVLRGVQAPAVIQGRGLSGLGLEQCVLRDNAAGSLLDLDPISKDASVSNSYFDDNAIAAALGGQAGARLQGNTVSGGAIAGLK